MTSTERIYCSAQWSIGNPWYQLKQWLFKTPIHTEKILLVLLMLQDNLISTILSHKDNNKIARVIRSARPFNTPKQEQSACAKNSLHSAIVMPLPFSAKCFQHSQVGYCNTQTD